MFRPCFPWERSYADTNFSSISFLYNVWRREEVNASQSQNFADLQNLEVKQHIGKQQSRILQVNWYIKSEDYIYTSYY